MNLLESSDKMWRNKMFNILQGNGRWYYKKQLDESIFSV